MTRFVKVDANKKFPDMERDVLACWRAHKTFRKTLEHRADAPTYTFYDGPPFATGLPHYGHIVGSVVKDVVPRYWTMRGYRVDRRWGWDCHGLPIENLVEKEMGSKKKKDIEAIGVKAFNDLCRSKVLTYATQWRAIIDRLGRWADMRDAYRTMDTDYMESVWWVFKSLWDKGLIYKDYRAMHICPRCETTLSQQEVSEGYQEITDVSVVVKFALTDEPGTFVLAWTTTPWTLPGNVALAVGSDIDYVKCVAKNPKTDEMESYIVARSAFDDQQGMIRSMLGGGAGGDGKDTAQSVKVVATMKGSALVGKKYVPLFDAYYRDRSLQHHANGWKIYAADFVTTDEGTGIVHIAPAFGEDDMRLGNQYNLPFVQHVGMNGNFAQALGDLAGRNVKPIDDHQSTDVAIVKVLAQKGLSFGKRKYRHSYPHCWRCDTPLINYATSSWFVNVTDIKQKALTLAKQITWSPANMKEGRFGKWLAGARDWSISRQRFWASVMPVWVCDACGEKKVVGSVRELSAHFGHPNTLFLVRHGEAESNVRGVINSNLARNTYGLTPRGEAEVAQAAKKLARERVDVIIASPFLRAQQTAKIIAAHTGASVETDDRLREFDMGAFDGKKIAEDFLAVFPDWPKDATPELRDAHGVEHEESLQKRLRAFVDDINAAYRDKNIVVVSHGDTLNGLYHLLNGTDRVEHYHAGWYPRKASVKRMYSKTVDLHKHVVDDIVLPCASCGASMRRVPDVLDTWFDSGSMPYAQQHYPFEHAEDFDACFPADFIGEGVDQTRAWFYYQHILAAALKDSVAFKNVIVNGIVLAEDGKKMSKKLKNYPDPMEMFKKYGADSVRMYLMSSPVVAAQNLNFSERDVADMARTTMRMLWNSYAFFMLYASIDGWKPSADDSSRSPHVLDQWIISELHAAIAAFHAHMEAYELHKAARVLPPLIDHVSNWYIRRSRKRFWKSADDADKNNAYATLYDVLTNVAALMAPFAPFMTDEIYRTMTGRASVHLADAPMSDAALVDAALNDAMRTTRAVISEGLKLRVQAKIKVRQPLSRLVVRAGGWTPTTEMRAIVCDELNVKSLEVMPTIDATLTHRAQTSGTEIALDTTVTPALALEGRAREIIRAIQQLRKNAGYAVEERIAVGVAGCDDVMAAHGPMIARETLARTIAPTALASADARDTRVIDGATITVTVRRDD